jgi:hypothetical protein
MDVPVERGVFVWMVYIRGSLAEIDETTGVCPID